MTTGFGGVLYPGPPGPGLSVLLEMITAARFRQYETGIDDRALPSEHHGRAVTGDVFAPTSRPNVCSSPSYRRAWPPTRSR
jgi:hypothetical protein